MKLLYRQRLTDFLNKINQKIQNYEPILHTDELHL